MIARTVAALSALTLHTLAQTIDPNSVDGNTKASWCNSQVAQCPLICAIIQNGSQATSQNDCDPSTLTYHCTCLNPPITPNASQYSLTIPYYECTQAATDCVNACPQSDTACQGICRSAHPCGAQDPKRYNLTTASASSSSGVPAPTGGVQSFNGNNGAAGLGVGVEVVRVVVGAVGVAVVGGLLVL